MAALRRAHPQRLKWPHSPQGPAKPHARSVVLVTGAARTLERLWAWASGACGAGAVLGPLCPQQPPPNTTGQRGLWGPAAAPDTVCHQPQACSQHSTTPDLRSVADAPSPPLLQKPGARVSVLDPSGSVLTALRPRTTRSPARSPLVLSSAGSFPPGRLEPAVVGARALLRGPSPCHRLPQFHPCPGLLEPPPPAPTLLARGPSAGGMEGVETRGLQARAAPV